MKIIVCFIGFLLFILPFSHAVVVAFEKARWKPLPKKLFYPAWALTAAAIMAIFALLPKCSSEEEIAPNGQTMMEHYEPRF